MLSSRAKCYLNAKEQEARTIATVTLAVTVLCLLAGWLFY